MPCTDITELIHLEVDDDNRLVDYRFIKRTCGQGVGADRLLMPVLGNTSIDSILAITPDNFIKNHPPAEAIEEFLGLKHLIAVQSALEVLLGQAHGGPAEICAAAEISCEGDRTTLDARINVDLVIEKIESCGSCKGCGKTTKTKKVKALF